MLQSLCTWMDSLVVCGRATCPRTFVWMLSTSQGHLCENNKYIHNKLYCIYLLDLKLGDLVAREDAGKIFCRRVNDALELSRHVWVWRDFILFHKANATRLPNLRCSRYTSFCVEMSLPLLGRISATRDSTCPLPTTLPRILLPVDSLPDLPVPSMP